MKIDFRQIIIDHFSTLRNDRTGRLSAFDIALFFALPIALGGAVFWAKITFDREVYNVSITFFGIFVALLLNVQVAIFGIFQRKPEPPKDPRLHDTYTARIVRRRELLSELNANLSYLTFVCCISLVVFIALFTFCNTSPIATGTTVLLYSHFLFTLMMTVKRTHILFQQEYRA
jgi:amino acid transporter